MLDAGLLGSLRKYDGMPCVPQGYGQTDGTNAAASDVHYCVFPTGKCTYGTLVGFRVNVLTPAALSCVAFLYQTLQVLHTAPKAAKAKLRSTADADTVKAGPAAAVAAASPDKPHPGSESSSSDLDSVFARLEEQEERAEKDGGLS